jgi:hypothetical protein
MTTSTRRKSAISNAKWVLSQRILSSREVLRFWIVLSDNVAAQNGCDSQGLFSLRVIPKLDAERPRGKFNWNFLLGVVLATGGSAAFWAGVAIALSGVLR